MNKVSLNHFLCNNPFPQPLTMGFFYREKMRAIHFVAPDEPFSQILEIGGGRSGLTAMLYPNARIINIDLNPEYSKATCNRQNLVCFVCGDAIALPFDNNSFDLVTMFDLLEHVPDQEKAAAEALRVLKPEGYLLVSVPNENWRFPYYRFMQPLCPSEAEVCAEWGHVRRGYSLWELAKLLDAPLLAQCSFITPLTVLSHDISFSRLPHRMRLGVCALLSPLTWVGYLLNRPSSKGTQTASTWQKTEQDNGYASGESTAI